MVPVDHKTCLFYYSDSPPEVLVSFPADDIQDKSFKVKFETKNINKKAGFQIHAFNSVADWPAR